MNFISEKRLKELLNNDYDFLFILNMDGDILAINNAVNLILEYPLDELKGKNLLTVYSEEYKAKFGVTMPLLIRGDITSCPYPFMKKDGGVIPVDTKFYLGWWNEENVIAVVGTNLSTEFFSREVFHSIFNNSQSMLAIGTVDSNILYNANRAFIDNIGYSLEEISGKTVQNLDLFCDELQIEQMLKQFQAEGHAEGEVVIKTKSAEQIICLLSFKQIEIHDSSYLLLSATNITQRKQMEEKLRFLNLQQKLLTDIAQLLNKSDNFDEMINTVLRLVGQHANVSRVYIYENTHDEQFTSNTYEWCNEGIKVNKKLFQMLPFDKVPSWKKMLNQKGCILSNNMQELPQDMIDLMEYLDVKSILAYPIYIQNHLWGFIGFDDCLQARIWQDDEIDLIKIVTVNITNALERKFYLNQIENSEMRLRLSLNGAREGMWDWNLITDEIYFTDIGYEIIDQDLDESLGKGHNWQKLIHPDDWGWVSKLFIDHKEGEIDYFEATFRVIGKSGNVKWILNHGKVIERDREGIATRAIGTLIDISKQKETEEQLKDLLATKDKLFSIISHDLRGPVGSFMQVIELLTSGMEITPDIQESLLYELKDMSKNTFYLLENLLNWSRTQRSEIVYNPRTIIVNDLIKENISLLSNTAAQKSITLQFEENTNYIAYADYDMINLVIRNILSNGIKFTLVDGLIDVHISEKKGFITVEITDNGVGMSQDVVDKLFTDNKFHSTYGTNNEKGSGLGLSLCYDFVKRNGGSIKVESVVNQGSKFLFTLPANSKVLSSWL